MCYTYRVRKFTDAKDEAIRSLRNKTYLVEARKDSRLNLLATAAISELDAIRIIEATTPAQASSRPLMEDPRVPFWIFKPVVCEVQWFVKFYRRGSVFFISFHEST